MEITIALTGDFLFQHKLSSWQDDGFTALVALLREADVSVSNLECAIYDGRDWPAFASGQARSGSCMAAPPQVLDEGRWMGIDGFTTANNHATDLAEAGVLRTLEYLDNAHMPHAGSGRSLYLASAPAYFAANGGRVALVACSDWGPRSYGDLSFPWPMGVIAADADGDFPARPGLNLLRYDCDIHLSGAAVDALRRVSAALRWEDAKAERNRGGGRLDPLMGETVFDNELDDAEHFYFMGRRFCVTDGRVGIETTPWRCDVERNLRQIREARRQADIVVCALHHHGPTTHEYRRSNVAAQFAREAIDAGADVFYCHGGAGWTGGVEVYNGKPIVYGVPTLCHQNSQLTRVPLEQRRRWGLPAESTPADFVASRLMREAGQENVRPAGPEGPRCIYVVSTTQPAHVDEVLAYPFVETFDGPIGTIGLPRLLDPTGDASNQALERLGTRMKGLGTEMINRAGVGHVRIA